MTYGKPRHSKKATNHTTILQSIKQPDSIELYRAVFVSVPRLTFASACIFSDQAIERIKQIDSTVDHSKRCSVISILAGLVQAGLVESIARDRFAVNGRLIGCEITYQRIEGATL